MAACPTAQATPVACVAPLRPALKLTLAAVLAAPGLSLAAPFLPNPAYLSARTQTDGIRFAPNPDEAPVDAKANTIEGAELAGQPVLTLRSDTVLSNGAQAHAQIEASMGVLKGKLSTHYEKTFSTDDGWVDAVFSTSFEDFIEVTAPGLAEGTPVTYTFSLAIDGTSGVTPQPAAPGALGVGFAASMGPAWLSPVPRVRTIDWQMSQGDGVFSQTFEAVVGELVRVRGTLYAGSQAGTPNATSDAWADYMSTARFHLTPSVAGANTVSVSGHDYALSAVPEPSTAVLFVMGALYVLAAWRGRLPHLD
jgi:hypothetical protein